MNEEAIARAGLQSQRKGVGWGWKKRKGGKKRKN
jgi:hypothetical protein